jgi:lysine-ketoglutarate reductase/saccharopine dehydrogenase-like protein (TIGR00300 family)
MSFKLPKYTAPDFSQKLFINAPNIEVATVEKDGVAPQNYHAMSMYPEYFKIDGKWILPNQSRMDCVAVVRTPKEIDIVEFRNLKKGDTVILGRKDDGSQGIYLHNKGFSDDTNEGEAFSFRSGRSRETAYSRDYDDLYDLLRYEKENNGYVVWVLGPAVSFDKDSRNAVQGLVEKGYVQALLAGNALATHDLEAAYLNTALGQDIYTQESMENGHYNHLDLLNTVRSYGSIPAFITAEKIDNGIIASCVKNNVPFVLSSSIRDDGPLPEVLHSAYDAQDAMRVHARKATTLICLATQLHTIATGNMTPSYTIKDGKVRSVFIYSVDISEFVVNKLRDRGTLEVKTLVTNVQDFVTHLNKNLD